MTPTPFFTGYLEEKDGHKVYYEEYGNKSGESIIVCHGGPGDKSKPKHVSSYELDRYHVILFDQRGCGKSEPFGGIINNTTQDLVGDMECIRIKLGINSWFVAGSSWGFTVALVYAETYPSVVKGLLLGSGFLARNRDEEWAFSKADGVSRIFPDVWEKRNEFLKKHNANSTNAAKFLLKKIQSSSEQIKKEIAAGVMNWEGNLMFAQEDVKYIEPIDVEESNIGEVTVFLHYEANNFFLTDDQILSNIATIKNIPTILVHGRYDLLCPAEQIWEVSKNLEDSMFIMLPTSNHRLTADGTIARKLAYNYFLYKHTH